MSWHMSDTGKTASLFVDDGTDDLYMGGHKVTAYGWWDTEVSMCDYAIRVDVQAWNEFMDFVKTTIDPVSASCRVITIDSIGAMDLAPKGKYISPDLSVVKKQARQMGKSGMVAAENAPRKDNKVTMRDFVRGKR